MLGKREDGYHELCTVFQTVSLHDTLTFKECTEVRLTCDDPQIPVDKRNLIVKAAEILKERRNVGTGASVHLKKRIPSPGGLGGGSSNAAAALFGLVKLWKINVSFHELMEIAGLLGSDVPFFLYGGTALGTGRGTDISPVTDFVGNHILIVTPDIAVSTREAFAGLNAANLTSDAAKSILNNCRFDGRSVDLHQAALKNDFETTVFAAHPEISAIKQELLDHGAKQALMSGSGASVFAIFDKEETRQTTIKALENKLNWRKFAVAAISRDQYREALGIAY